MGYDLTVLIPTFNEEDNVGRMIETVDSICRGAGIAEEILVVDDSSRDRTATVVRDLEKDRPNVHLLVRTRNPGLSQSLYDGMIHAQADLVQCLDCDFSHPPEKIPVFYQNLKSEGYDMVIGSRYVTGGEVVNWPFSRRFMSSGAALLGRLLIPHVKDSGSGFFAINRKILEDTALSPRGSAWVLRSSGKRTGPGYLRSRSFSGTGSTGRANSNSGSSSIT